MQLEEGAILEGKVTGITGFGVFVELEKGTTGMVHISEVSNTFVNEIKDFVQEGDVVKVKVLQVSENGKISLSMKRAVEQPRGQQSHGAPRQQGTQRPARPTRQNYQPRAEWVKKSPEPVTFEDMMAKFKQSSDEKFSDLKRKNGDIRRNRRAPR